MDTELATWVFIPEILITDNIRWLYKIFPSCDWLRYNLFKFLFIYVWWLTIKISCPEIWTFYLGYFSPKDKRKTGYVNSYLGSVIQ